MWGPYTRTPYGRPGVTTIINQLSASATYVMQAAIDTLYVITVILTGVYYMKGYRVRLRLGKYVPAVYVMKGKLTNTILKQIKSSYILTAGLSSISNYYRTLAASYELKAGIVKRMFVTAAASYILKPRRLTILFERGTDFSGDVEPGDRVIIDSKALTVTVNGVNALHFKTGNLPIAQPGDNALTYSDSGAARELKIRVKWRGEWL